MNNSEQKAQAGRLLENNSAYSLATRLLTVEKEKAMLERELEKARAESDELSDLCRRMTGAGTLMSNACYNLAQWADRLPDGQADILKEMQVNWDTAIRGGEHE